MASLIPNVLNDDALSVLRNISRKPIPRAVISPRMAKRLLKGHAVNSIMLKGNSLTPNGTATEHLVATANGLKLLIGHNS
jgi:hypothetical protein